MKVKEIEGEGKESSGPSYGFGILLSGVNEDGLEIIWVPLFGWY